MDNLIFKLERKRDKNEESFEKKKLLIEFVNKSGVSFGTENEVISALSKQCEDNQEYKELLSDIENNIDEYRTTFRQLNIL